MGGAMTSTAAPPVSDRPLDAAVPDRLRAYNRLRPPLGRALRIDALRFAAHRGDRHEFSSRLGEWWNVLKMLWSSDDYAGLALYRLRAALQAHHVPLLPSIINRICITLFRIDIGEGVVVREGVYIPHGNVMLHGVMLIGRNTVLCPWIGLGCKQGSLMGPYLRDGVFVGTHVTVIGDLEIGERAILGAGALVTGDVPAFTRVAGVPAKPIPSAAGTEPVGATVAS